MDFEFCVYPLFEREAKRLAKRYSSIKDDIIKLKKELSANPYQGVSLGHGLYKIRMRIASKGKGKSGGARVIALILEYDNNKGEIGFHYIYDKSEYENLTDKEIKEIIDTNLQ